MRVRGKGGAALNATLLALSGSGNHARRPRRISLVVKDSAHVGLDRASALHKVEDFLSVSPSGLVVSTKRHPPSWSPRLVDEAAVLEVIRSCARLLLRCLLPIGGPALIRGSGTRADQTPHFRKVHHIT